MKRKHVGWTDVVVFLLLLVAAAAVFHFRHPAGAKAPAPGGTPVSAVVVKVADVPVYIDALGTVVATRTVAVITQVNGILDTVDFKEGQVVKKGQVTARIDSRTLCSANVNQAKGNLDGRFQAYSIGANDQLQRPKTIPT